MAITIRRADGGGYTASVTPPHGREVWHTSEALNARDLVARLRELDCHTTDIADAFYAANPDWLKEVD